MKDKPAISVIVATKNRPDYLFRCLLGIKLNTFQNYECIVVGDHCNYSSKVMQDEIFKNDSRFHYYNNTYDKTANVGAVAKNIGAELAVSNRICYCDDDNVLLSNHLQIHSENENDLVYTKFIEILHGNKPTRDILSDALYGNAITGSKIDYKDALVLSHTKQVWREVGGWKPMEQVGYNEDRHFMIQAHKYFDNCKYIDEVTAIYNQHQAEERQKEHTNYLKALENLQGTYVYPELVEKLKEQYVPHIR